MNNIEYEIKNKRQELAALIWTATCICFGVFILDIVFSYSDFSNIVSVLMPLYFLIWLTIIFAGHYLIKSLFRFNFYTTSILGAQINSYMRSDKSCSTSIVSWVENQSNKGIFPRLTPLIDSATSSATVMEAK